MPDYPPSDPRYEGAHTWYPEEGDERTVSSFTLEYLVSELSRRVKALEG